MRHPKTCLFLRWFGPAVLIFLGALVSTIIAAAAVWPSVADWAANEFTFWWPIVTSGWFVLACLAVIAAYLSALIYAGKEQVTANEATPAPQPTVSQLDQLPELKKLYLADFEAGPTGIVLQFDHEQLLTVGEDSIAIEYKLVLLFDAHAKLLAIYIPQWAFTDQAARYVAENIEKYVDVGTPDPAAGGPGHEEVRGSDLTFTRKVFIYHEASLSLAERGAIDAAFREKGLVLQLRSTDYALSTMQSLKDKKDQNKQ